MAQTIKLKRSSTSGAVPTTSQLELGEVAINTYDGKMYIKKNVGGTETIVDITGGGSSSSADSIVQEYQYTATAGQTTFSGADDNSETLAYTAGAIQIFLNGVLLDPSTDYTASNTINVVLTSAAAVGDYLQIFAFKKKISDGNVSVDTFSGNNSTTAFTLSLDPGDENNTRVFIDGVYQSKSNYTVSGTTLTFSSAPPSGTAIEVEIGNRNVTLDTTANLDLPDNVKLRLGTSQDADFYHDSTDTYLRNQTGQLLIRGNDTKLQSYLGQNYATFANSGAATLYHANSAKFATTSTGVDITGNIVVSGTVDGVDLQALNTTAGAALPKAGGAMTGAITTNSTFDGRNVSVDGTKLDGIESGATGDQTQAEINALGITATGLSGTPAISVANITTTGELRGPASLVIDPAAVGDNTGTVVIKGNLQVDGATTTINSTTLTVDDLNITLASGAANGTAANGAGITVDGASATITYVSSTDSWDFNKKVKFDTVQGHGSNNFLIDSPAAIQLDSHNGYIRLRTQGGDIGTFQLTNNDLTIRSMVSDRDIIFQGYDGSTNTTALSLDMSEAGSATFNNRVGIGGVTPQTKLHLKDTSNALEISLEAQAQANYPKLVGASASGTNDTYFAVDFVTRGERLRVDGETGNVGIGTTAPSFSAVNSVSSGIKGIEIFKDGTDTASALKLAGDNGSGTKAYAQLGFSGANATAHFANYNTSGTKVGEIVIGSTGNVGIGETNPSVSRLHVRDNKGSAGDVWTQVGAGNNMGITLQNETTADNANSVIYFKNDTDYVASIGARYVSHSTNETEIRFGTTNSSGTTREKMYLRGGGELQTLAPVMVGGSVGLAASQISGTPSDQNYTEVGKGYINLARDDTADAAQIRFAKNGSVHSYLETRTTGLGFVTNVGGFDFNTGINVKASAVSGVTDVLDIGNAVNAAGTGHGARLRLYSTTDKNRGVAIASSSESNYAVDNSMVFYTSTSSTLSEKMRIDSSGRLLLGVASATGYAADQDNFIIKGSAEVGMHLIGGTSSTTGINFGDGTNTNAYRGQIVYHNADDSMRLQTAGSERVRIDSKGNLGFGVTPNANWSTSYRAIDAFGGATLQFEANSTRQGQNFYGYPWKYKATRTATSIAHTSGGDISFQVAPSGTADSAITWSQAMLVKNSGKVGIGTDSPAAKLHISGNSDVSDEDCMLIIDDVDGSAGSRIPAIMFRSNTGGTVTNQARIRGTDTHGIVMSGSSALSDDLVVQAGGVGIGTTSPQHKFDTVGTIRHTSNIVSNTVYKAFSIGSNRTVNDYGGLNKDYWAIQLATPGANTDGQSSHHAYGALKFSGVSTSDTTLDDVLVLNYNGNVGIGTASPSAKLHIDQSGNTRNDGLFIERNGSTYGLNLYVDSGGYGVIGGNGSHTPDIMKFDFNQEDVGIGTSPVNQFKLEVYDGDYTQMMLRGPNYPTLRFKADNQNSGNNGRISIGANNTFNFNPNNATTGIVISNDGSVGIGTTSPANKLHIKDTSTSGGILLSRESSNAGAYLGLKYQHSPTDSSYYAEMLFRQVDTNHGGQIEFWTDNSVGTAVQRMVINKSGNVGIGTDSPGYLVHAENSTATGQSVIATSGNGQFIMAIGSQNSPGVAQEAFVGTLSDTRFKIKVNNTVKGSWTDNGLAIGTQSSAYTNLDVAGQIAMSIGNAHAVFSSDSSGKIYIKANENRVNATTAIHMQMPIVSGSGSLEDKLVINHTDITAYEHFLPSSDNTYDLGSAAKRWRNIYTGDLHLSNETQKKGNDVDGTKGNWTVQEGEENLYLINNKTGKKYKFALEEIE